MNKERLLNVAKALRESPNPDEFTMDVYVHPCGTPACAFGHYAAREDLQDAFRIVRDDDMWVVDCAARAVITHTQPLVLEHFGLSYNEAVELFSAGWQSEDTDDGDYVEAGCGGAKTALEAAEYIERFVRGRS